VCGNNLCVAGPGWNKVTCNDSQGLQQYCGEIGDGCASATAAPPCPSAGRGTARHAAAPTAAGAAQSLR